MRDLMRGYLSCIIFAFWPLPLCCPVTPVLYCSWSNNNYANCSSLQLWRDEIELWFWFLCLFGFFTDLTFSLIALSVWLLILSGYSCVKINHSVWNSEINYLTKVANGHKSTWLSYSCNYQQKVSDRIVPGHVWNSSSYSLALDN